MARGAAPGRVHPEGDTPQDARRRELEALVYGEAAASPAEVAELRALLAPLPEGHRAGGHGPANSAGRGPASRPLTASGPSADGTAPDPTLRSDAWQDDTGLPLIEPAPRPRRRSARGWPARGWLAGGVVAVVLAGLIGAGATSSILGSGASREPNAAAGGGASGKVAAAIGASSPATGIGPAAEAEALGAQYFDQPQSSTDRPDVSLPGIDPLSTRRVLAQWGQSDGEASVWVARGRDASFCLIMSVGSSRAASSCTPLIDAASTGVRLDLVIAGGGSISARWNLQAGLLELSPFPAGASIVSSGPKTPKP